MRWLKPLAEVSGATRASLSVGAPCKEVSQSPSDPDFWSFRRRSVESFVNDLRMGQGVVLGRAVSTLRSVETHPSTLDSSIFWLSPIFFFISKSPHLASADLGRGVVVAENGSAPRQGGDNGTSPIGSDELGRAIVLRTKDGEFGAKCMSCNIEIERDRRQKRRPRGPPGRRIDTPPHVGLAHRHLCRVSDTTYLISSVHVV